MTVPQFEHIIEPLDDGGVVERFRIKTVGEHYIEVIPMLFTWRIHTVRIDEGPLAWSERFWCYEGRGQATFLAAVLAAHAWDGADDTEPAGWVKSWDQRKHGEPYVH